LWKNRPLQELRIAGVPYDWQEDMYGLTEGYWFPPICPEPVQETDHIRVMKFRMPATVCEE
jgi:hypothetical protein